MAFLSILATASVALADETLPLVTLDDRGTASAWWVEQTALPPLVHAVVDGLSKRGFPIMDPDARKEHPRVSRVYRSPRLTRANATNLAGLYGATHALAGTITRPAPEEVSLIGLHRQRITASLSVIDVRSGAVLIEVELDREGQGATAAEAGTRAESLFVEAVVTLLASEWTSVAAGVGVDRPEPWIVLTGVVDARTLDVVRTALIGIAGVQGARLAWVAPGRVAFDLNPSQPDELAAVDKVVQALVAAAPAGLALRVTSSGASGIVVDVDRAVGQSPEGAR